MWRGVEKKSKGKLDTGESFSGADPGEVKWVNFHPPFSEPPLIMLMHRPQTPQPGFRSITLLQKFTPSFQNPGSAPVSTLSNF